MLRPGLGFGCGVVLTHATCSSGRMSRRRAIPPRRDRQRRAGQSGAASTRSTRFTSPWLSWSTDRLLRSKRTGRRRGATRQPARSIAGFQVRIGHACANQRVVVAKRQPERRAADPAKLRARPARLFSIRLAEQVLRLDAGLAPRNLRTRALSTSRCDWAPLAARRVSNSVSARRPSRPRRASAKDNDVLDTYVQALLCREAYVRRAGEQQRRAAVALGQARAVAESESHCGPRRPVGTEIVAAARSRFMKRSFPACCRTPWSPPGKPDWAGRYVAVRLLHARGCSSGGSSSCTSLSRAVSGAGRAGNRSQPARRWRCGSRQTPTTSRPRSSCSPNSRDTRSSSCSRPATLDDQLDGTPSPAGCWSTRLIRLRRISRLYGYRVGKMIDGEVQAGNVTLGCSPSWKG